MPKKIKTLKNKLWKLFSQYIRRKYADRFGNVQCVTCPTKKPWKEMQAGHFIDGRTNSILFDERCVHPQCYSCNVCKHGNKVEYFRFMQSAYGDEIIDELRALRQRPVKITESEYEDLIKKYKNRLLGLPE